MPIASEGAGKIAQRGSVERLKAIELCQIKPLKCAAEAIDFTNRPGRHRRNIRKVRALTECPAEPRYFRDINAGQTIKIREARTREGTPHTRQRRHVLIL